MYCNLFGLIVNNVDQHTKEEVNRYLIFIKDKSILQIKESIIEKTKIIGWETNIDTIIDFVELQLDNAKKPVVNKIPKKINKPLIKKKNKYTKEKVIQLKLDLF